MAELLRAAESLFAAQGYEATTMSAIASSAGASIGSLYQYFPNKEDLGAALLQQFLDDLAARLQDWGSVLPADPDDFSRELIDLVIDEVRARPACVVLAEVPQLMSNAYRLQRLSESMQALLQRFSPHTPTQQLPDVAVAAWLLVRAANQAARLVETTRRAALVHELQLALGAYLRLRLPG